MQTLLRQGATCLFFSFSYRQNFELGPMKTEAVKGAYGYDIGFGVSPGSSSGNTTHQLVGKKLLKLTNSSVSHLQSKKDNDTYFVDFKGLKCENTYGGHRRCLAHIAWVSAQHLLLMMWFVNFLLCFTHMLFLIISVTLQDRNYSVHFTEEEKEHERSLLSFPRSHFQWQSKDSNSSLCFLLYSILILYLVKNRVAGVATPSITQPHLSPFVLSLWHLPCSLHPWHGSGWLPWDPCREESFVECIVGVLLIFWMSKEFQALGKRRLTNQISPSTSQETMER